MLQKWKIKKKRDKEMSLL